MEDNEFKKDATLKLNLKSNDGFRSSSESKISAYQYGKIVSVIEETDKTEFTKEDIISFAKWCEDALLERINVDTCDSFAFAENISEWREDTKEL